LVPCSTVEVGAAMGYPSFTCIATPGYYTSSTETAHCLAGLFNDMETCRDRLLLASHPMENLTTTVSASAAIAGSMSLLVLPGRILLTKSCVQEVTNTRTTGQQGQQRADLPGWAELQTHWVFPRRGLRGGVPILSGVLLCREGSQVCGGNGLSLLQNPLQAVSRVQPYSAALAIRPQHIAYLGSNVLHCHA
jgi:hypothetical protein